MGLPERAGRSGFVVWIEGLPASGKTTLSRALTERLRLFGRDVEVLDGDDVRKVLSPELSFSRKDRATHARRVSYLAYLLARHGVAVVVAMITPYETTRQAARSAVQARFIEVWLRCPLEVCRQRDSTGIYQRSDEGFVSHLTGVDDPFEEPLTPDVVVDTSTTSVEQSLERVLKYLTASGIDLAPSGPPVRSAPMRSSPTSPTP